MTKNQRKTKSDFLIPAVAVAIAVVAFGGPLLVKWLSRPNPPVISKTTTFVEGPLRKDGTIDYGQAFSDMIGKGVTHDNNAAVLFVEAFGPSIFTYKPVEPYYEKLGMSEPDESQQYFVSLKDFIERRASGDDLLRAEGTDFSVAFHQANERASIASENP